MAKNRKNQSATVRFGPAVKAFALCVIIGGAGVGYVWQKSQISQLERQITQREMRLAELKDQNKKMRDQLATLQSPGNLEKKMRDLNMGLVMPQAKDVWRVAEPRVPPTLSESLSARQLASR